METENKRRLKWALGSEKGSAVLEPMVHIRAFQENKALRFQNVQSSSQTFDISQKKNVFSNSGFRILQIRKSSSFHSLITREWRSSL